MNSHKSLFGSVDGVGLFQSRIFLTVELTLWLLPIALTPDPLQVQFLGARTHFNVSTFTVL